jgi:hypothetical protein
MAKKRSEVLVREYFERVSGKVLEDYGVIVGEMIKGHAGVYALYKNDRLYYVGLASNMMRRINQHLKDRHRAKWDRFSVYLTNASDHIRPLEALVLRIVSPSGNRKMGRLSGAEDLFRTLSREMSERDKDNRAVLLGERAVRVRRRRKSQAAKGSRVLDRLISRRMRLKAWYKGKEYSASMRRNGEIQYKGKLFNSPTAAAQQIIHRSVSGWKFWHFQKGSNWVPLADLRR